MIEIGSRIKSERERLGLSQQAMAEVVGSSNRTIIAWEQGSTSPTSVQLFSLSEKGFDVLYIVTGNRTSEESSLRSEEARLVKNYRIIDSEDQKSMLKISTALGLMNK